MGTTRAESIADVIGPGTCLMPCDFKGRIL